MVEQVNSHRNYKIKSILRNCELDIVEVYFTFYIIKLSASWDNLFNDKY